MQSQTLIYRHRKENLKKCSLRGLECRKDLHFYTYPQQVPPYLEGMIILSFDGPLITPQDKDKPLLLIDGTWRLAQKMEKSLNLSSFCEKRSLPSTLITAYPRRQSDCPDQKRGLASIEALYSAYYLMDRDTEELLNHYIWKDLFLKKNQSLLQLAKNREPG